jgi:hypothetical protein
MAMNDLNLMLLIHSPKQDLFLFPNSQILKNRKAISLFLDFYLTSSSFFEVGHFGQQKNSIFIESW